MDAPRQLWGKVTDEGVTDTVEAFRKSAADTLMRGMLRKLAMTHGQKAEERAGDIYCALMAAKDAGYECGIRVQYKWNLIEGCFAVIHTPDGMLTFELIENWDVVVPEDISETPARISQFLTDQGAAYYGQTPEEGNTIPNR